VSKSSNFANAGCMYDIRQPLVSTCFHMNECAISKMDMTAKMVVTLVLSVRAHGLGSASRPAWRRGLSAGFSCVMLATDTSITDSFVTFLARFEEPWRGSTGDHPVLLDLRTSASDERLSMSSIDRPRSDEVRRVVICSLGLPYRKGFEVAEVV
jgi:hypothetical protein